MIKYFICPDYIKSKYDGDIHFISAMQLMNLYHVTPGECIVLHGDDERQYTDEFKRRMTYLRPQYNGDYSLPCLTTTR